MYILVALLRQTDFPTGPASVSGLDLNCLYLHVVFLTAGRGKVYSNIEHCSKATFQWKDYKVKWFLQQNVFQKSNKGSTFDIHMKKVVSFALTEILYRGGKFLTES